MHWDGWAHMGWMWIWWILVIAGLVFLLRWLVQSSRGSVPESPEQELKRRYARGEMDREEFQRRLEDLRR